MHGSSSDSSATCAVPGGSLAAFRCHALWGACERIGGRATPPTTKGPEETSWLSGSPTVRHRGDLGRGTRIEDALAPISSEVGRIQAGVGGVEAGGQRVAGGSHRDLGANVGCTSYGGVREMELNEDASDLKSLLRKCPGCGYMLTYNEGQSSYALLCDGPDHNGPAALDRGCRYSCLSCGRYDFCLPCAHAMLSPPDARQVRMRLRGKNEGAALEYTFSICDHESMNSHRPRKQRDYTHRHCIPRERYLHLEKENTALKQELARLRRTLSLTCDSQKDIFETAAIHQARNLSKEKHNSREVQRYKEEVHKLNARTTTLALHSKQVRGSV